jgi:hypothetical protein
MTFPEGEGHPDYRFTKTTKDGRWGIYYPRTDADFDREAWQRRKAEREERERELERQRRETCLSPEQRDREYRRLLAELTLSESHRQHLLQRGMSPEEIQRGGYVSIQRFQKLQGHYHPHLPGVNRFGHGLTNSAPGLVVPIRNAQGQMVAYQYRTVQAGQKAYPWAKGAKTLLGEQPIGVAYPSGGVTQPQTVGTGEGFLKTQIASNRLGIPFLGAAGGNFTPQETRQALEHLGAIDRVIDFPDAGWKTNPHVARTTYRRVKLIESLGYPVFIADWGQAYDKTIGDIDELSLEQLSQIQLLTLEQAFADTPLVGFKGFGLPPWIQKALSRKTKLGKGLRRIGELFRGHHAPEILKVEQQLRAEGYAQTTLLITSPTGAGKTHETTQLENPQGKTYLIANNHRSLALPDHIQSEYADLKPRNQHGFYRDGDRLVMATQETPKPDRITNYGGYCAFADRINQLRQKNYDHLAHCGKCPFREHCNTTPGWFLQDARETFAHPKIRLPECSLPVEDIDPTTVLELDELTSANPVKTFQASLHDLRTQLDTLRYSSNLDPSTKAILRRLEYHLIKFLTHPYQPKGKGLTAKQHAAKQRANYGYAQADLIKALSKLVAQLSLRELMTIEAVLEPDISGDGIDEAAGLAAGLTPAQIRAVNRQLSSQTKVNEAPVNILPLMLRSFSDASIQIRLHRAKANKPASITAMVKNHRLQAAFSKAGTRRILDASATPEDVQLALGIEVQEVICKQVTKHHNHRIIAIRLPGLGTFNPTEKAIEKLQQATVLLEQQHGHPIPRLGPKAHKKALNLDGHWLRDNRATNRFAGESILIGYGIPYLNLGAIQDEYHALGGSPQGFEAYYQRKVNAEILQLPGRHRSDRYPDQPFITYLFIPPDVDLSWLSQHGYSFESMDIAELDASLSDRGVTARLDLVRTIQQLLIAGTTVTGQAIADTLGKSRQAIQDLLTDAGIHLADLVDQMAKLLENRNIDKRALGNSITATCQDSLTDNELIASFRTFILQSPAELAEFVLENLSRYGTQFLEFLTNNRSDVLASKAFTSVLITLGIEIPPRPGPLPL